MTRRDETYYVGVVTITIHPYGGDMPGFLDMLRYDGCTVVSWTHTKDTERSTTFTVTVRRNRPFTIGRWHSYGLVLRDLAGEVIRDWPPQEAVR